MTKVRLDASRPVATGPATATPSSTVIAPPAGKQPTSVDAEKALERGRQATAVTTAPKDVSGQQKIAGVAAHITTPALVANPGDFLQKVERGKLHLSVPLEGGAKVGMATIREGTIAVVDLVIRDGRLDRERTRVRFENKEGRETSLDGPFWINPDSLYIDASGHIRAEVPCFPDPNVTEDVLGPGIKELPENMHDLMRVLGQAGAAEAGLPIVDRAELRIDTQQTMAAVLASRLSATVAMDADAKKTTQSAELPPSHHVINPDDKKQQQWESERAAMTRALDFAKLNVTIEGTLMPGAMRLGDDATIQFGPGNRLIAKGSPSNMRINVDGNVSAMNLQANGTRLSTGPGQLGVDIHMQDNTTAVSLRDFDLANVQLEAPAGKGERHQLTIGHIHAEGGTEPLVSYRPGLDGSPAELGLSLPQLALRQVRSTLITRGADGAHAVLKIGGADGAGVDMRAGLELDSRTGVFSVDAEIETLRAHLGGMALVDAPGLDLSLASAELSGSARLEVRGTQEGPAAMRLEATHRPIEMQAHIADGHIGEAETAPLLIDVAAKTQGRVLLKSLDIAAGHPPYFEGAAAFEVRLDELRVPMQDGQSVQLTSGTTGKLTFDDVAWRRGDASPTMHATLHLDLGATAAIDPTWMPGMEGVRLGVDAATGHTTVELTATLSPDGLLTCDCGLTLHGISLRATTEKNMAPLPDTPIPQTRLAPATAPRVAAMRTPVTPLAPPTPSTVPELTIPPLPTLRVSPVAAFAALQDTKLAVRVPVDAFSGQVHTLSARKSIGPLNWGYDVKVWANLPTAGELQAQLVVNDHEIEANRSFFRCVPPMSFRLDASAFVGPQKTSTQVDAEVRGLVFRRDPATHLGYLEPEVVFKGDLPAVANALDLEENIRLALGSLISTAVLGQPQFAPNKNVVLAKLVGQSPALAQPVTVEGAVPTLPPAAQPAPIQPAPNQRSAAASPMQPPTQLSGLVSHIHPERAKLSVGATRFAPGKLDLGNGQFLTINTGSLLQMSGDSDDFVIEGRAVLGPTHVGSQEAGAKFDAAKTQLRIRVRGALSGTPKIELELSDIHASAVQLRSRGPTARVAVTNAHVTGGSLCLDSGTHGATFTANLPEVSANLLASGGVSARGITGQVNAMRGTVAGSLHLKDGAWSGDIRHLDFKAEGVSVSSGATGGVGNLGVSGSGRLHVSATGDLSVEPWPGGKAPKIQGSATLTDGTNLTVREGTVGRFNYQANPMRVELEGMSAQVSALVRMPQAAGLGNATLDIRSAKISGNLQLTDQGLTTRGRANLRKVDISLANIRVPTTDDARIDLRQIDLSGSGQLTLGDNGMVRFDASSRTVGGTQRSSFVAAAVARDIQMRVQKPDAHVDLANGAAVSLELDHLVAGGRGTPSVALRNGVFTGRVEGGSLTVGHPGAALETIPLSDDTLVRGEITYLRSGEFAGGAKNVELDATLRIEGKLALDTKDVAHRQLRENVTLEELNVEGGFQMIGRTVARGAGDYAVSSRVQIDGKARVKVSAQLVPLKEVDKLP